MRVHCLLVSGGTALRWPRRIGSARFIARKCHLSATHPRVLDGGEDVDEHARNVALQRCGLMHGRVLQGHRRRESLALQFGRRCVRV
jgi:hypothetical protein